MDKRMHRMIPVVMGHYSKQVAASAFFWHKTIIVEIDVTDLISIIIKIYM